MGTNSLKTSHQKMIDWRVLLGSVFKIRLLIVEIKESESYCKEEAPPKNNWCFNNVGLFKVLLWWFVSLFTIRGAPLSLSLITVIFTIATDQFKCLFWWIYSNDISTCFVVDTLITNTWKVVTKIWFYAKMVDVSFVYPKKKWQMLGL